MRVNRLTYANIISNFDSSRQLFIDETGFNLHIYAKYGYMLPCQAAYYMISANREKNVSLVAIFSCYKIEHFQLNEGLYNTKAFVNFLNSFKN